MDAKKIKLWAWHIPALLFFVYLFGITTNYSINDPDIWWHLKTGEYIAKTKDIPDEDLFSYTGPRELTEGQVAGLQANWLAQVVFYSSYRVGGFAGVGFLRGLLIVLPVFAIYLWLTERGSPPWLALGALAFVGLMLSTQLYYAFERPQGLSFLLALMAVFLLEDLRRKKKRALLFLPLLMAVWSNVHGGYIIGDMIIALYIAGEGARWIYNRLMRSPEPANPAFFIGALSGVLATGLNPNGFTLFYNTFRGLIAHLGAVI